MVRKSIITIHFCDDQHLDNQRIALRAAGCQRIYEEKISGAKRERPELTRVLDHLREGDVLVATRLDRLAHATRDLLELAEILNRAGVGLRSLGEPWADTTSPSGKMVLTVFLLASPNSNALLLLSEPAPDVLRLRKKAYALVVRRN